MRTRSLRLVATLALLLIVGFVPALAADKAEVAKADAVDETLEVLDCGETELFADEQSENMTQAQLVIGPKAEKLGCVGKTCADYPVPVNGSCSCSSQIIAGKCLRTCDGRKGRIVETSCTICGGCTSPPCDINSCNTRKSRHCVAS